MAGQADRGIDRTRRRIAARDGEEIALPASDGEWVISWHPPPTPPDGTPHGSAGLCVTGDGGIVLISQEGEHWDVPGGRPEGQETWEETLRREVREEACATVAGARLLGFCRGVCIAGPQVGRVTVRSLWRADVELAPWEPRFEVAHRRVVAPAEVVDHVTLTAGFRSARHSIACRTGLTATTSFH